jgi:uroporphyrin-III C-methyltransferase
MVRSLTIFIDAAQTNATVVVLMGIHKLAEITEIFKSQGKTNCL